MKTVERLVKLGADLSIKDGNGVSMCVHTTEGGVVLLSLIHRVKMHPAQWVTLHNI